MLDLFFNLKVKHRNKKVYIYGAGMVAYYLAKYILSESEFDIDGFLVSDINNNPKLIFEKPVFELSDKFKDELVIIGTKENLHNEINAKLESLGYKNIIAISNETYGDIRAKLPDTSYEMMNLIKSTNSNVMSSYSSLHNDAMSIHAHINNFYQIGVNKSGEIIPDGKRELQMSKEFSEMIIDESNYLLKVQNLVRNLDIESKDTVFQILHRLRLLSENKPISFTAWEKEEVKEYLENFYPSKYMVSENWYYYDGYNLPIDHFELSVFWHKMGLDFLSYSDKICNKDVIDAGAYIGDSALIISEYTNGNIYGFEAFKDNFELMQKTIEMNSLSKLQPINMGLSDKIEAKELYISDSSSCNCFDANDIYTFNESNKVIVNCTTIDQFVKDNNLNIGLIKSDIEGGEQQLLEGAIDTIKTQKPTLLISIYHSLEDFFNIKKWIEDLDLGYEFKIYRPVMQHHFISETVLIAETPVE